MTDGRWMGPETLGEAIAASLSRLGRFGASYPVYLERPPGHEVVPSKQVLAPEHLRSFFERSISAWTDHPEEEDVRAAASRFVRRFCGSMASAALVPLANGVAFDVSIPRVSFLIRDEMPMGVVLELAGDGVATSPGRLSSWPIETAQSVPTADALRTRALTSLFSLTIVPAFTRVLETAHVSARLLWATAAEQIDSLYEHAAVGYDASGFEPYAHDRAAILFGRELPGIRGPNPLLEQLDWEDAGDPRFPRPLQVRRICCVCYVIPGRVPSYCRTCGLISKEERLELWRAWLADVSS